MSPRIQLSLNVVPGRFAIARFAPGDEIPSPVSAGSFYSVTRTPQECSLVCDEKILGAGAKAERGRALLAVAGPLAFAQAGVLASLAVPLAEAKISIFALSTFDTDYLLLSEIDLDRAIAALEQAGHHVKRSMNA